MKKLFQVSVFLIGLIGLVLVGGGIWGLAFTASNVAREKITTPDDSAQPGVLVRGPLTLKVQADIIRKHTLKTTDGKTFSEMPRQIPKVGPDGRPILDEKGQPVLTANTARDLWITATTLVTALNLGLLAYGFFGLMLICGLVFILLSFALRGHVTQ